MATLTIPNTPPIPISSAARSSNNMLHVLEYSPKEGEPGVPVSVRLHFNHNASDSVFLRLVVGTKAVATSVRELDDVSYGRFQLDATAPSFDSHLASDKVLLSVQALDNNRQVLDCVTFGEFTYWLSGSSGRSSSSRNRPSHKRQVSVDNRLAVPTTGDSPVLRRRAATVSSAARPIIKSESPKPRGHKSSQDSRRIRANSLMRAKYPISKDIDEDLYAQTPILQIITPLNSMCSAWDPAEIRAGRRLVRFTKVQDGRKLILSCEPVLQEDYNENDSVISCIYREETSTCYVTSVDIIYLLERLTNDDFPVEEKNRIRRNLEGLRPTTVSKHKPGFELFFQRIMEFPDPKPRNIEKDLKVFEWALLGQALDKILSKYHVYTSSPTDSTVSLPAEPSDDHSSPSAYTDTQVVQPGTEPELQYPELVHPTPTITTKYENILDDHSLLLFSTQDSVESLCHPASHSNASIDYPYSLYQPSNENGSSSEHSQTQHLQDDSHLGGWVAGHNRPGDLGVGEYHPLATYQLAEMSEGPPIGINGVESEFDSYGGYGSYTFSREDSLSSFY